MGKSRGKVAYKARIKRDYGGKEAFFKGRTTLPNKGPSKRTKKPKRRSMPNGR